MHFKGLSASIELSRVLAEARDLAEQSQRELMSGHLLLGLFLVENRARSVLTDRFEDRSLSVDDLLTELIRLGKEPIDAVSVIHHKTAKITESCGTDVVGTLHLLAGICRVSSSVGYRALKKLGVSPTELRTAVISQLTGGMPRHYLQRSAAPPGDRVQRTTSDDGLQPELQREAVALAEPEPQETEPADIAIVELPLAPLAPLEAPGGEQKQSKGRWALDPETFPTLTRLGRNLTDLAESGQLDPLIGRQREVEQLVDILNKRRSNNPCLVGDPGVGKTAVVEGLAQLIVAEDAQVGALGSKILVELEMGSLVAGTRLRGAFAERLGALKEEVAKADGRIVLFIDELHTLIGAGAGDGALDAANDLKTALARGVFPCIGATTEREYRRHIESDPALERRFEVVLVDEPTQDEALDVLRGLEASYSAHHKVRYRDAAVEACVQLADRWIAERCLPAKAIDVMDLAGAWAARHGHKAVSAKDVARVVAAKVGVPAERLLVSDAERLLNMEEHLQKSIVAHEEPVTRMSRVIRRNFAGFTSNRPMGSFLLLGPTGVGKTESARVLAQFLFGSREAMTRIDMSEYMDAHSVSRLIGAPPGFVGHEDGGQLTETIRRRPYQLVCFDEVEKASGEVLNVLLQLLEEGALTDGRGRHVRFQHTVIIMTSNLGQDAFDLSKSRRVGFGATEQTTEDRASVALESARKSFSPELWNRIEEKLVFEPLTISDVERVASLLLADSARRLQAERKISYTTTDDVIPLLIERGGYDQCNGARPMRRVIQDLVEGLVADHILRGATEPDMVLSVGVVDGELAILS